MSDEPRRPPEEPDAERDADNTIGFRNVDEQADHDEAPGPQHGEESAPSERPEH
jgi:hypothetical protein